MDSQGLKDKDPGPLFYVPKPSEFPRTRLVGNSVNSGNGAASYLLSVGASSLLYTGDSGLYRRPGRSSPGGGASRGDGGDVGVSPRLSGRSSPGGGCSIGEASSALGSIGETSSALGGAGDTISSSGRAASTPSSGSGVARSASSLALLLLSSQNESETIVSSSRAPTPSHTAFVPLLLLLLLLLRPILPHMLLSPPSLFAPPTNHTPIQPTLENPPLLFLNTLPSSRLASGISHLLPLLTMTKNNTHATPTSRGCPF